VAEFEQALAEADKKIAAAEQEFQGALQQVNDKWAKIAVQNEDYLITPFKKDITVDLFGIGWIPHWYVDVNGQPLLLPAFNG
jgi:hypothetical protein